MDGTNAKADDGKAAAQPAAGEGEAKPLDAPAAADEEQVDDALVERFYALLANIRAMRGAYTAADSGGARRKRLRSAGSSWKPAFRLEDFDDDDGATSVLE